MDNKEKKYPEGYFLGKWMGIGMVIFSGIGIPLSIITDNPGFIGIGPALGVAFGLAIGQSLENKYKEKGRIRPLTEFEIKRKKIVIAARVTILSLGVLIFILLLFL